MKTYAICVPSGERTQATWRPPAMGQPPEGELIWMPTIASYSTNGRHWEVHENPEAPCSAQ